ncbi:hypothetical protein COV19_03625 [Candidatus Woesearchaeota archaeon CG10_big_fil_rev_8_21_14_0_10_44_13]|nr:MAG: hypothetical protein COV19_03625 [Candidatus Woesearchaeota archaeon CG10_big_fil_rev_8_21_14_0_10_44_13]
MMAPIRLLFIIWKNLKLIFRSWTSIMLVVIGPLLLIAIIGFAFRGDDVSGIKIGIYAKDTAQVKDVVNALYSKGALVYYYSTPGRCMGDVEEERLHLCARFSDDFFIGKSGSNEFSAGDVNFYYDNSKMNLVNSIVNFVKDNLAIQSEQITLESTKEILTNIEDAVNFMFITQAQIANFTVQAEEAKKELIGLRDNLVEIKSRFDPSYKKIKGMQSEFNMQVEAINSTRSGLKNESDSLDMLLDGLLNESLRLESIINSINTGMIPGIGQQINVSAGQIITPLFDFAAFSSQISAVKSNLSAINGIEESSYQQIENISIELNLMVSYLDEVNGSLLSDIEKLDKNINGLNKTIIQLNQLSSSLDERINTFSGINQEQAGELLKPIKSFFNSLLGEKPRVFLIFPVILSFIIMFISALLSNMTVLNEINSSAHFRNFLLPIHNTYFIVGLFITNLIIVISQVLIFLWVGYSRFDIALAGNFWQVMLIVVMLASIFIMFGMALGYMIRSEQTSILTTTMCLLAMFLFSDIIFPAESMPQIAANLAYLNPIVVAESMFRKTLFYNIPLGSMAYQILILCAFILVLFLAVVVSGNRRKK